MSPNLFKKIKISYYIDKMGLYSVIFSVTIQIVSFSLFHWMHRNCFQDSMCKSSTLSHRSHSWVWSTIYRRPSKQKRNSFCPQCFPGSLPEDRTAFPSRIQWNTPDPPFWEEERHKKSSPPVWSTGQLCPWQQLLKHQELSVFWASDYTDKKGKQNWKVTSSKDYSSHKLTPISQQSAIV